MKQSIFKPIRSPGLPALVFFISILLMGVISTFINPAKIDSNDLRLIAWNPGRELLATGNVNAGYPYPLWTVVVMLPFALLPQKISMIIWLTCNLLMLASSIAIFILMTRWELTPITLVMVVSLCGLFLPVLTSFSLGQLTFFSLLAITLAAYFFINQKWIPLGVTLGISLVKPQVMILLIGMVMLQALLQHRWRVLISFSTTTLILVAISLPFISSPQQIIGGGIGDHLGSFIERTSTIWSLFLTLGISWFVPLVCSIGLMGWLLQKWIPFFRNTIPNIDQSLFLFSASVIVNLIVLPYSWMYNLVLLLLPYGYSVIQILKIKDASQNLWLAALLFIMYPLTIALFVIFEGHSGTQAHQIIPAFFLLAVMIALESKSRTEESSG